MTGGRVINELPMVLGLTGVAASNGVLSALAVVLAQYGPEIMALAMAVLFFAAPKRNLDLRRAVIYGAGAAVLALVVSLGLGAVVFRARPEYAYPHVVHALVAHANDSSFPSDHAAVAFALAVALFYAGGVAWPFLAVAVLVALGRVAVGVHWPTDVLAGAAVGALSAALILKTRALYEEPIVKVIFRLLGVRGEVPQQDS